MYSLLITTAHAKGLSTTTLHFKTKMEAEDAVDKIREGELPEYFKYFVVRLY